MNEWVLNTGGYILKGETQVLRERPVLVLLCPPQIPHGLARGWTLASVPKVEWYEIYGEFIITLTLFSEKKGYCFPKR